MARDELDLSDIRPSLIGRVVLIGSTLAVVLIAAWLFAPILLAKYNSFTARAATGPKAETKAEPNTATKTPTRAIAVAQPQAATAVATASTAPAPGDDATPPPATTAVASAGDNATPPTPAATTTSPAPADNALTAWPTAAAAPPPPPPAAPVEAAAPPPASADTMQLASAAPTAPAPADTNADTVAAPADQAVVNVPLPRSRPSRLIAARLAIPLPRPRPDIVDSDAPTPAMRAFELQVERMR